jgi:dTDP-4-dehydrorhamnose 3,5-epimerase
VLSEVADFSYLSLEYHDPQSEQGIAWIDPDLGISWAALAENRTIQLCVKEQCNSLLKDHLHIFL